jgi:hypothetical protein
MVIMDNLSHNNEDSVLNQYISSHDKNAVKKTLAFKYFNNDMYALDQYINNNLDINQSTSLNIYPKAQLEFTF